MKTGYLSRAYQPVANAGSKPRYDVDTMLTCLGAKPLGLPTRYLSLIHISEPTRP